MEKDAREGMTAFEIEVLERLARMEPMLQADYKAIHGNGHKGLVQQVADLESRTSVLESKHTLTTTIIGWLVSTAIAIYALFK